MNPWPQCRLKGDVTTDGSSAGKLSRGRHECDVRWVHHDGTGYLFARTRRVQISNETQSGSWRRISGTRSGEKVTDDVFTLSINHGAGPQGDGYAYFIFPGVDPRQLAKLANKNPCEILANTADVQAVYHAGDSALGAVFYSAGGFTASGWTVTADRSCALVYSRSGKTWTLSAADPACGSGPLTIVISRPDGRRVRELVTLPRGNRAGASVIVKVGGQAG